MLIARGPMPSEEKRHHYLDVKTSLLEDLSLGDEVIVQLRGKVTELRAPRDIEYGDGESDRIPGSIEIIQDSIKVKKDDESAFSAMVEED